LSPALYTLYPNPSTSYPVAFKSADLAAIEAHSLTVLPSQRSCRQSRCPGTQAQTL